MANAAMGLAHPSSRLGWEVRSPILLGPDSTLARRQRRSKETIRIGDEYHATELALGVLSIDGYSD